MNPDQQQTQEPTLDESITQVMRTLPPPVRTYLANSEYTPVTKMLMEKYGLHIDQAAVLEREIMLLIMGIETPDEFAASMTGDAQFPQNQLPSLMADLNQEIFIPLREKMRQVPSQPSGQPTSSRPMVPAPSYMPKPAVPVAAAPAPRPVVQSQPIAPGQRPAFAPLPPKAAMPQPSVAPAPRPKIPVPPIQPSDIPMGITLGEPRQLKNLVQPAQPRTAPPPANLPGAMPPTPASAPQMPVRPPVPVATQPAPVPVVNSEPVSPARTVAPAIPGVRPVAAMPVSPRPVPPLAPPRTPGTPDPYREPIE